MVQSSAAARASQAVSKTNAKPSTKEMVSSMEGEFAKALPRGIEATRFLRDAMTVLSATPRLKDVDQISFVGALMTCAQLGLRPGVGALGEAYIIPFKGKANFVLGYQGMTTLAHRSGMLDSVISRTVHEADDFSIEYGTSDKVVHRPPVKGARGAAIGYYAVVKVSGGGYVFDYMSIEDMRLHRDKFAMARDRSGNIVGPWKSDFDAMARKTMVRKLWPYMPRSTEMQLAAAADNTTRVNLDPAADVADVIQPLPDDVIYDEGEYTPTTEG